MVHGRPSHVDLSHHRSHPPGHLEKLRLVGICLRLLQPGLHPSLLDHDPIRELIFEPFRFKALSFTMLNGKTTEEVVKFNSLDGGHSLLVRAALTSDPEVNMLLAGILVKVEIAIALIKLALLAFWNCH